MGAEEMAHANWRLDNPPVVDVAVSRRMGLFVVARLAARHGIRVRLRPAPAGGLTALVWLPDEVVSHESSTARPGMRRFDVVGDGRRPGWSPRPAVPVAAPAGLNLARNGSMDGGTSPAEQEINAARAPRFGSQQPTEGTMAAAVSARAACPVRACTRATRAGAARRPPARCPPSGRRPPRPIWRRTRTGPKPCRARTATADRYGSGPMPAAELAGTAVDFSAAPASAPSVDLGQPTVRRSAATAPGAPMTLAGQRPGRLRLGRRPGRNGDQGGLDGAARHGRIWPARRAAWCVPPAEHVATENRLPIFEAVESDWFRRGRSWRCRGRRAGDAAAGLSAARACGDRRVPRAGRLSRTRPARRSPRSPGRHRRRTRAGRRLRP